MKSIRLLLVTAGVSLFVAAGWTPRAKSESPHDTLTEWAIPFSDITPNWIAAAGDDIVFTNFDAVGYVCRLNPVSGLVTRWQLPYTPTVPGGVAVRSSDHAVFVTGLSEGDIEQFDLETGVLRRWPMPAGEGAHPVGPLSLTVARDGTVLFLAYDTSNVGTYVGRLNTATGSITLWPIPVSEPFIWQLALGSEETVIGNFSGFGPRGLFRLDIATGTFTIWSTGAVEPVYAIASDGGGRVYFRQIDGSAWGISRFEPATGQLTRWDSGSGIGDRMIFSEGMALFGNFGSLTALDVSRPGAQTTQPPSPPVVVAPVSFTVSPGEQTVVGETATAAVQSKPILRQRRGAFDTWATGTANDFAITTASPDVYFTDGTEVHRVIGRVTRN
jgi:streptogramin lyase